MSIKARPIDAGNLHDQIAAPSELSACCLPSSFCSRSLIREISADHALISESLLGSRFRSLVLQNSPVVSLGISGIFSHFRVAGSIANSSRLP
jgi:hypothetical protein